MRIIKLLQLALILFFLHCTNTTNSNSPKITRGNIDFHSWNFSKQGNVKLNGEWFFFPNKILKTEEILEAFFKEDRAFYWEFMGGELKKIPGEWNEYTNPTTKEKMGGSGFASYVISVKNINFEGPTGLEIKEEGTAYEFFICVKKPNPSCNLISKNGIVGKSRTSSVPQIFHTTNLLPKLPEDSIFVMNISNFHHREGGFWEEITIGDFLSLIRIKDYRASISFISLGIILVMGFYHLGLFSQRREDKASLFFSLFCFIISIRSAIVDRVIHHFLTDPVLDYFEYLYKLEYLSVYLATPLFFSFIYYVFKEVISKKFGYFLWIVSLLFCVTVIFFDTIVFSQFITYFYIVLFTGCLYGIYGLIISSIKKLPGAKICLIGFTGFVITIVNDIFYSQGVIRSIYMAHYGFLFFIFSQSMILSFKFSLAFRESESLRNSMERFVPIQFLKSLDKSSISDINVGDSINKQYSVLFTDIRDFTSLSESMTPQDNFLFLNTYLKYMEPAIKEHNGFIDKFIGDAIMALFEGNPGNAVNAALSMTAKLIEYNHEREKDGLRPIEIGVGINSGDLILGTVGTHNRLDTTVIGDTVNLSSRLESLNKKFGTTILISESVYLTLHDKDIYDLRELGFVKIKGKQKAIKIYEIFNNDKKDIKEKKSKTLKEFTSGINNLKISDYKEAYNCFIRVLREFPEDKISKIYLNLSKKKINQFNLGDTNPMIPDISELA